MTLTAAVVAAPQPPLPSPGFITIFIQAVRRNLIPGLILQAIAVIVVVSYFTVPAAHQWWQWVATVKASSPWLFTMATTTLLAAWIPGLILSWTGHIPATQRWRYGVTLSVFWLCRGVELELFYRLQDWLFPHSAWGTVAKVAFDQFVYTALWVVWVSTLFYRWLDAGCRLKPWRNGLNRSLVTQTIPTVLLANWVVWIPTVAVMYCLPQPLQMPLCSVMLCFWALLLGFLTKPAE